jgi:hypothetical protein
MLCFIFIKHFNLLRYSNRNLQQSKSNNYHSEYDEIGPSKDEEMVDLRRYVRKYFKKTGTQPFTSIQLYNTLEQGRLVFYCVSAILVVAVIVSA